MKTSWLAAITLLIVAASATYAFIGQHENSVEREEFFNYTLHFCPEDDCLGIVNSLLLQAKHSIRCALYTADNTVAGNISRAGTESAEIVMDKNAKLLGRAADFDNLVLIKANSKGLMHSKYCIIDGSTVLTGSFNPTFAARKDSNNLIIINSSGLARIYSNDFNLLKNKSGKSIGKENELILNETSVKVHFCPYGGCSAAVEAELQKARESIQFADYSFTNLEIANELILKHAEGIKVLGIMEKSGAAANYSLYRTLSKNGINVTLKKSKGLMHHKFFVIDGKTVITGSFNPTENADRKNNENIIIIKNEKIALAYEQELISLLR